MITIQLTTEQFFYLRHAVRRDLENLEEMAPWDIDENTAEHEREIRLCKAMGRMLAQVEQEQALPF